MLNDFAFIACGGGGPMFTGEDLAVIATGLISLLLAAIMVICNAVMLFAMEFHGQRGVGRHLLGWFAYVGSGVLIVMRSFSFPTLTLAALAIMALTIIIIVHLLSLVHILRQCRSSPERYSALARPCRSSDSADSVKL